ncbi:MAG: hypothetical protein ACW98Y_12045 [Candidatus Thorarchaeota archaeon]|jgi:hypothetical protein
MSSESSKTRKILGIVVAIAIFVAWIFVDMYTFPSIAGSLGYPVFELVAYGSWFVVLLVMLAVLSVTGAIPGRSSE